MFVILSHKNVCYLFFTPKNLQFPYGEVVGNVVGHFRSVIFPTKINILYFEQKNFHAVQSCCLPFNEV